MQHPYNSLSFSTTITTSSSCKQLFVWQWPSPKLHPTNSDQFAHQLISAYKLEKLKLRCCNAIGKLLSMYLSIISNNCRNSFATNLQKCKSYKQNGYNIEVLLLASSIVQGAASMQLDSSAHRYSTARIFISLLRTQLVDGRWARQMVLCEIDPCFVFSRFRLLLESRAACGSLRLSRAEKGILRLIYRMASLHVSINLSSRGDFV
jgi:hypothetical protein